MPNLKMLAGEIINIDDISQAWVDYNKIKITLKSGKTNQLNFDYSGDAQQGLEQILKWQEGSKRDKFYNTLSSEKSITLGELMDQMENSPPMLNKTITSPDTYQLKSGGI